MANGEQCKLWGELTDRGSRRLALLSPTDLLIVAWTRFPARRVPLVVVFAVIAVLKENKATSLLQTGTSLRTRKVLPHHITAPTLYASELHAGVTEVHAGVHRGLRSQEPGTFEPLSPTISGHRSAPDSQRGILRRRDCSSECMCPLRANQPYRLRTDPSWFRTATEA